ncbi:GAF and ANTAR domain-containing protein [Arthrobacter sp. Br18]|uniref:GAF and ANTAR domain-containing protein n=1 Tax=Arthrobacter sp. Br18 TaxID=1312954 RepID=UPI0004AFD731|nr:GAF and ANTAR domain-containing protein [Arthrobacter sp. Br18]
MTDSPTELRESGVDSSGAGEPDVAALLQDLVLDSADVEEFLIGLVKVAGKVLSGSEDEVLCAVTLLRPRMKTTVASSSENARKMDEVQYRFDDGPCLRAAREGHIYYVEDFREDDRFPRYGPAIAGHGIRSALAVPIPLEGDTRSALNIYSPNASAFDPTAMAAAQELAGEASASLRLAIRIARLTDSGEHLRAAMESRTAIDLAAGVIMAQNRCSQDAAMTILKAASNTRNVKLRDVAAAVLASVGQDTVTTHFS